METDNAVILTEGTAHRETAMSFAITWKTVLAACCAAAAVAGAVVAVPVLTSVPAETPPAKAEMSSGPAYVQISPPGTRPKSAPAQTHYLMPDGSIGSSSSSKRSCDMRRTPMLYSISSVTSCSPFIRPTGVLSG